MCPRAIERKEIVAPGYYDWIQEGVHVKLREGHPASHLEKGRRGTVKAPPDTSQLVRVNFGRDIETYIPASLLERG
jgi:hypothetical protein